MDTHLVGPSVVVVVVLESVLVSELVGEDVVVGSSVGVEVGVVFVSSLEVVLSFVLVSVELSVVEDLVSSTSDGRETAGRRLLVRLESPLESPSLVVASLVSLPLPPCRRPNERLCWMPLACAEARPKTAASTNTCFTKTIFCVAWLLLYAKGA
ncbi:hypothetical protein DL96DRAFT_184797 [Flagelloscypha sp. PMI_526]|nr:hypothetical protein DL96DRAFT_184797 [Flagelloscypha sp. PMI_526]